jgi:hypothetical protein
MLVAALSRIAEGSRNLMGGHLDRVAGTLATGCTTRFTPDKDVWSETLNVRPRARELRRQFSRIVTQTALPNTAKITAERRKIMAGSLQPEGAIGGTVEL